MKNISKTLLLILLSLALSSCAHRRGGGEAPDQDWSFQHGGISHRGHVDTDFVPTLKRKWKSRLNRNVFSSEALAEYSSPVAAGNIVYFGSVRGGGVRALDYRKGSRIWSFGVEEGVEASPAYYEGKLYFGGNNGIFYALDAKSGELIWQIDSGTEILSGAVAEGGMVFFVSSSDLVYALDAVTGKTVWRYKREAAGGLYAIRPAGSPAYADGTLYATFRDGTVVALVAFDGSVLWKRKMTIKKGAKFIDIDSSPVVDGKALYVSSYDGGLFKLDATDGELIWMHAGGTSATPAYDEERVYCSDRDGRVYALDKENGDTVWEYELKDGIATSGIVVGDSFIFGSSHKKLYLLDKKSGKVEGKRGVSGGLSAPPAFYKGYIYLLSNEGHAYALGK